MTDKDGGLIQMPTQDPDVLFQRLVIREMCTAGAHAQNPRHGVGVVVAQDPRTGRDLTRGEFFDQHARTMLVISEVEKRSST